MFNEGKMFVRVNRSGEESPDYLIDHLKSKLSTFSEEDRKIIEKKIKSVALTGQEKSDLNSALDRWWRKNHAFTFDKKDLREKYLTETYAPTEEGKKAMAMQNEMFASIVSGDKEQIAKIENKYLKEYPEQIQGIEVVFEIRDFMEQSFLLDKLKKEGAPWSEKEKVLRNLTEYQFLITHYMLGLEKDGDKDKILANFWKVCDEISESLDEKYRKRSDGLSRKESYSERMGNLRRGIVGQVASYKLFEELGFDPQLSHPDEDAFKSVDMWAEDDTAVQVKNTRGNNPEIYKTEYLAPPSIKMETDGGEIHVNEKYSKAFNQLQRSVSEMSQKTHKTIKGYVIVIPNNEDWIDQDTGDIKSKLVEFFRNRLEVRKDNQLDLAA